MLRGQIIYLKLKSIEYCYVKQLNNLNTNRTHQYERQY